MGYDSPSRSICSEISKSQAFWPYRATVNLHLWQARCLLAKKITWMKYWDFTSHSMVFQAFPTSKTSKKKKLSSCVVLPHSKGLNIHRQLEEKSFYQPRWCTWVIIFTIGIWIFISGQHREASKWNLGGENFYTYPCTNSIITNIQPTVQWQQTFLRFGKSVSVKKLTPRNTCSAKNCDHFATSHLEEFMLQRCSLVGCVL